MAAVIDWQSCDLEAARIPSDNVALLEHNNFRFIFFAQSPGSSKTCRAGSKYGDSSFRHLHHERNESLGTLVILHITGEFSKKHFFFFHRFQYHDWTKGQSSDDKPRVQSELESDQ